MMKPSDNNVENWIEEIHREHYDSFLRYAQVCFRIFGRGVVHRAEDAFQLTYEKVWMKKEELLTKDDPIAWFYAVLKNTVRELSRDDMRWQMHMNQIVVLMVTTGGTEFVLRAELKSMMTDEEFQLMKRLYINGQTYDEVSADMGVKKSTLAMRVNRIKKRIVEENAE